MFPTPQELLLHKEELEPILPEDKLLDTEESFINLELLSIILETKWLDTTLKGKDGSLENN